MDKQLVEEMEKDLKTAGLFAMDWLCAETKQIVKEHGLFNSVNHTKSMYEIMAEELIKKNYCKIPEGAVVLTGEEKQKLLHEMYEQGKFDAIADLENDGKVVLTKEEHKSLIYWEGRFDELIKLATETARKEMAETFAETLKAKFGKSREYYEIDTGTAWSDGQIGGFINKKIDEICKEITEGQK